MDNNLPPASNKKVIMIAVVIVIVLGLGYLLWHSHNKPSSNTVASQPRTAIVQITKDGFVPATISVQSKTKIEWTNTDTKPHRVDSNPYPSHSDLPGLVSEAILPGGKYSYTFSKTGNFKYYDGDSLTSHGVIEVQ